VIPQPEVPSPAATPDLPAPLPVATAPETTLPAATEPPPPAPAPKKRAARKSEPAPEPALDLPIEESPSGSPASPIERTISSDGATRLLVTAYIGIGNRLFIRGEGPGLSWDRGVPLQFVSIGKWRWETSEASAPIKFKLFKNDTQECPSLGEQALEPGHLHELTADF